jgi:hypothetical protein
MFPRIERTVLALLEQGNVVAPVDVLVGMGMLAPRDLVAWRRGSVPYLERVIQGSLTRLTRLLRILRMYAHDLNLVPVLASYQREGARTPLRFSKTHEPNVEEAYRRHFTWPGKRPFGSPRQPEGATEIQSARLDSRHPS